VVQSSPRRVSAPDAAATGSRLGGLTGVRIGLVDRRRDPDREPQFAQQLDPCACARRATSTSSRRACARGPDSAQQ